MSEIHRFYVDSEFGQIHGAKVAARNPAGKRPLFCLHQSPKNHFEFETFMVEAARDRDVYGADYPGYGMSTRPPNEADASIEMYARNMWRVADTHALDKLDLFGNHTGSKVALEMARQQPGRVGAIAMVSAAILTDEERARFSDFFSPIPLDREGTRIIENWRRIVAVADADWPLEKLDRSFLQTCMGGEAYEWGHAAAFAYTVPFEEGLSALPHRKIILNPRDDLQECTRRAAPLMNNGEIIELPNWTYGFLDIHAKALADLLLPKLDAA